MEELKQDTGSRLLIGAAVTVALLLYIMIVPDPLWTPILLLCGAAILRIYVKVRKVEVDVTISQREKRDIIFYAMLGLLGMLVGGTIVKGLYEPPLPPVIETLAYIPFASVLFCQLMAISEELYFRGELFQLFGMQFGPAVGNGATTVLFGIYHLNRYGRSPGDLAYVLVGGFILAWTASKTARVLTPMIAHCLNNFIGTAFLVPAIIILCIFFFIRLRRGKLHWRM